MNDKGKKASLGTTLYSFVPARVIFFFKQPRMSLLGSEVFILHECSHSSLLSYM